MIVSDRHKYVYIAIPRTGSVAMSCWLTEHYGGRQVGGHHSRRVADAYADHLVFTVVRDPYCRMLSAWWFCCQRPSPHPDFPPGLDFGSFMERWRRYHAGLTQVQYVDEAGCTEALHLELLSTQITRLPFVSQQDLPVPRDNTSDCPHYTARFFRDHPVYELMVWDYCTEDFERFGYRRLT
jgi:hypothetical protein